MTAIRCSSAAALFIYKLFNDAVSSSDYMASNVASIHVSHSGESAAVGILKFLVKRLVSHIF
jgi:hypothetical protein